jgi:nucleotide-binding universal stress UspA family protein
LELIRSPQHDEGTRSTGGLMATTFSIRSILVATDLSPGAEATLKAASGLASSLDAELHVVHALEPSRGPGGEELLPMQRRIHDARSALRTLVVEAIPARETATARVVFERASAGILRRAAEVAADLIVIGPHRVRGLGDGVLGTTADQLVRESTVPCLIARGAIAVPPRRIVVPSDLSEVAAGALGYALRLGGSWSGSAVYEGAAVTVVHVDTEPAEDDVGIGDRVQPRFELDRHTGNVVSRSGVDSPVVAQKILRGKSPADEIARYVRESGAELLVMGTRGDRPLVKVLLGSVSAAVARAAEVPLLLLPPAVWMAEVDRPVQERAVPLA